MKYKWLSRTGANLYPLVMRRHPIMKYIERMPGRELRTTFTSWFHMAIRP